MGADFYTEDYLQNGGGGGGGYYDGGGDIGAGGDFNYGYGTEGSPVADQAWGLDTTSWPTFEEYYGGGGLPPDYAPGFGPETGFMDLGGGYVYDPSTGDVLDTGLWQGGFDGSRSSDLYGAYLDYYMNQGLDFYEASALASEQAAAGSILTPTYEQAPLPDVGPFYGLPYIPNYDYWQSPPYIPTFPEEYFPLPPPPLPPSPATQQPNLPPYCPQGQYHPYPIGHPQQNVCVPFPVATTPSPQPRPAGQPSGGAPSAPRPPAQQQRRPPQQQRCTTPGTVFDQATGRCVPRGQAISPLPIPSEAKDLLTNLKELPWWVWLAAGGLLLLSQSGEERKKVTVQHRRAS